MTTEVGTQIAPVPAETAAPPSTPGAIPTPQLIAAMLKGREHVSDLIFSPGHAPQVEMSGDLVELKFRNLERLTPQHTAQISRDLIGTAEHPTRTLEQNGSADLSYSVPSVARFRVNIFRQRGTYAIVMRVIPDKVPTFEALQLPPAAGRNRPSAQWDCAGYRAYGLGKIFHARRHRESHERTAGDSYSYDRRSHRVSPQSQKSHSTSA